MKKLFLTFAMILLTISLIAQKTQYYDLIIQKTTPLLHLYGSGGIINWNNGDLLLTHSSNMLTLTGGNLDITGAYSMGINSTYFLHQLVIGSSITSKLYNFNFVNTTTNKNRTTVAQATDSSSLNLRFTYTGSPLLTMTDKNGNVLFRADSVGIGLGTGVAQHKFVVLTDPLTKLNAFNFVNTVNKRRDTPQQAADSSSFNLSFTTTGSPMLNLTSKTGTTLLSIDSTTVSFPQRPYGILYAHDATLNHTLTTASVYYTLKGLTTTGLTNNITLTDSTIIVGKTGVYLITGAITGITNQDGDEYHVAIFTGTTGQTELTSSEVGVTFAATTRQFALPINGLVSLTAADVIKIRIKDVTTAAKVFTLKQANIIVTKIN
jgi:hypothetical protein